MSSENIKPKEPFWKTTTGMLLKIAGFIGAITTLVTFVFQIYSYASSVKDGTTKEKITHLIEEYYRLDSIHSCDKMAVLFTPVVEDYFDKSNFTQEQITKECVAYRSKWVYYTIDVDYTSLVIKKTNRNTHLVTYNLLYKTKKKAEDDWRNFPLAITVEFNEQFKIQSMYEIKK